MMIQWRKSQSAHYLHLSPALSHTYTHTLISLLQCPRRPITQLHQAWKHIRWDAESDVHCRWQCAPSGRAPPVAVRRCYRSCAEVKKRRAARWGHSVGCVWRRHRKVSSGFLSRLTCSSIGREHHGKQSSAASSPAPGRGHRVPVPRHLETFRQWW